MIKEKKELSSIHQCWDELVGDVINEQINDVIIACTDLSILTKYSKVKINFIDSSKSLAEAVVKEYLK